MVTTNHQQLQDIRRVFGGHPSETQRIQADRHARQLALMQLWPELHEVLMASIGLDPTGKPHR